MLTSVTPDKITVQGLEHVVSRRSLALSCAQTLVFMSFAAACGGRADQSSREPPAPTVETDVAVNATPIPAATEPPTNAGQSSAPDSTPPAPRPVVVPTTPPGQAPPDQVEPGQQPAPEPPAPEPDPISVEGCSEVGAYNRVFIFQRDASTGICTDFVLLSPDIDALAQPSLSLPELWGVEDMSSFDCALDGSPVSGATPTYFTRADGNVAFGGNEGGLPLHVQLDVVLSVPAEDVGTAAGQIISQQRLEAAGIDLLSSCSLRD